MIEKDLHATGKLGLVWYGGELDIRIDGKEVDYDLWCRKHEGRQVEIILRVLPALEGQSPTDISGAGQEGCG